MPMQEFSLYSQIPAGREKQVLNLLAGVTGTQPVEIYEQTLFYAQRKVPPAPPSNKRVPGKQQPVVNARPQMQKLYRALAVRKDGSVEPQKWMSRLESLPEPGSAVISRPISESELTAADLERMHDPDLYAFKDQILITGHRFVRGNVIVRITRFWLSPESHGSENVVAGPPPSRDSLKIVDPSGSFVVEALVRIEDSGNAALSQQAIQELQSFANEMHGAINFILPDRLALDPRIKS